MSEYTERLEEQVRIYWANANSTRERGVSIQNSATAIPEGESEDAEFEAFLNLYRQPEPASAADDPEIQAAVDSPETVDLREETEARRQEEIAAQLEKWGFR